ncbi:proteasome subunit beta type-4-like, partial [Temnothorax curvispinosus]|uniref:Proteasome subunit beta type-4 n=1 Tax=Temnothorax curvispinosus TaxID=300111 RepID=A0A6J1QMQ8_9HYME
PRTTRKSRGSECERGERERGTADRPKPGIPTTATPSGSSRSGNAFYHFPGSEYGTVGFRNHNGIIIAADVLGSYGSLARYRNLERLMKVNDNIILGASGDYADFQCIKSYVKRKILEKQCLDDGFSLKPKALHCWLTRVMYNRRSNFDPFLNNFIIAGLENGEPFLRTVDKLGTAYNDPVIATGYGAYMSTPILRKAYEDNNQMNKEEAIELLYKVMQVLFYRDARSFPKYHLGIVTKEKGVEIQGPLTLDSFWGLAAL